MCSWVQTLVSKNVLRAVLVVAFAAIVCGQARIGGAVIEAETIKIAPPFDSAHPVRAGIFFTPGRLRVSSLSVRNLVSEAYAVRDDDIIGSRAALEKRYDIAAVLSSGSVRGDVPEILTRLLAERFGMKAHY